MFCEVRFCRSEINVFLLSGVKLLQSLEQLRAILEQKWYHITLKIDARHRGLNIFLLTRCHILLPTSFFLNLSAKTKMCCVREKETWEYHLLESPIFTNCHALNYHFVQVDFIISVLDIIITTHYSDTEGLIQYMTHCMKNLE